MLVLVVCFKGSTECGYHLSQRTCLYGTSTFKLNSYKKEQNMLMKWPWYLRMALPQFWKNWPILKLTGTKAMTLVGTTPQFDFLQSAVKTKQTIKRVKREWHTNIYVMALKLCTVTHFEKISSVGWGNNFRECQLTTWLQSGCFLEFLVSRE